MCLSGLRACFQSLFQQSSTPREAPQKANKRSVVGGSSFFSVTRPIAQRPYGAPHPLFVKPDQFASKSVCISIHGEEKNCYIAIGEHENDVLKKGFVVLQFEDGSSYQGNVNEKGQFEDFGILTDASGTYRGFFKMGQKNGQGRHVDEDAQKITTQKGNFQAGVMVSGIETVMSKTIVWDVHAGGLVFREGDCVHTIVGDGSSEERSKDSQPQNLECDKEFRKKFFGCYSSRNSRVKRMICNGHIFNEKVAQALVRQDPKSATAKALQQIGTATGNEISALKALQQIGTATGNEISALDE